MVKQLSRRNQKEGDQEVHLLLWMIGSCSHAIPRMGRRSVTKGGAADTTVDRWCSYMNSATEGTVAIGIDVINY